MVFVFEGKRAIVTGGSRGLGRAVAGRLHAAGADVLLVARSATALADAARAIAGRDAARVQTLAADLASDETPGRILDAARKRWDGLDILINNAATLGPVGPFSENDWGEWQRTLAVNLLAPVALARLATDWMRASGRAGSVVNLSGGGATASRPRFSAYACSKTALVRFTETAAEELAGSGVRLNCVAPGVLPTDMLAAVVAAGEEGAGPEEYGRAVKAEEDPRAIERAVELIAFLASSASSGISGRLISAAWDPWQVLAGHTSELDHSDIYTLRRIVPADRGKQWQ